MKKDIKQKNSYIVVDLDGTPCKTKKTNQSYSDVKPNINIVRKLKEYKNLGYSIAILTSRNMRTYKNNLGKINAVTLKTILEWLERYSVPYDEIYVGKPWCGLNGFYIDDKTIRPDEFINLTLKEIHVLLEKKASE